MLPVKGYDLTQFNEIRQQKLSFMGAKIKDGPRPEIAIVPVVVVQTTIVAIEIPRVVSVVLGNTASTCAIKNLTTCQLGQAVWHPFDIRHKIEERKFVSGLEN